MGFRIGPSSGVVRVHGSAQTYAVRWRSLQETKMKARREGAGQFADAGICFHFFLPPPSIKSGQYLSVDSVPTFNWFVFFAS